MLSTLKNLDNTLGRCVGAVQAIDGKLGSKSSQMNSHALMKMMTTPLRGKPTKYFTRKIDDQGKETIEEFVRTTQNNEALTEGLLNYTIFAFHDPSEICEISQDTIEHPVMYIGAQNPQFYRVYNEPMYRQYNDHLLRNGKPIIDPATRIEVANRRYPYNPDNYRRAYPEGTAIIPHTNVPPQFHQPVRQSVNQAPTVAAHSDGIVAASRDLITNIYPAYLESNREIRFSNSIITRVNYAIKHFLMDNESSENGLESNSARTSLLMQAINLHDLYTLFHFNGETQPVAATHAQFRGFSGFENNGIIFIRDRPYAHHFQNGRLVLDRIMYIEFFVHVLQAYFYTGLTQRRPSAVVNLANGTYTIFIPYVFSVEPFETKTAIFEVELENYMDVSQRWILTMVNRSESLGVDEEDMHISPPEFDGTGNPITYIQATEIANRQREAADTLAARMSPAVGPIPAARVSPVGSRSNSEASEGGMMGYVEAGTYGYLDDGGIFHPDPRQPAGRYPQVTDFWGRPGPNGPP